MANIVQQHAQYSDFFMSGRGKKHAGLGCTSTVDSVLSGRDTDRSGQDPHSAFMSKFEGYAGVRSSGAPSPSGKKAGASLASQMDTVVWGRDMDASGDHDATFEKTFAGRAGVRGGFDGGKKKQWGIALQSTVDSVVFGNDLDKSGEDVHQRHFETHHSLGAGCRSGERPARAQGKATYAMQSAMDSLIYGHDIDGSGEEPHEHFTRTYEGYAGAMRSDKTPRSPKKGVGHSVQSSLVDAALRGGAEVPLAMGHGEQQPATPGQTAYKNFVDSFRDHAGAVSDLYTQRLIKQEYGIRKRAEMEAAAAAAAATCPAAQAAAAAAVSAAAVQPSRGLDAAPRGSAACATASPLAPRMRRGSEATLRSGSTATSAADLAAGGRCSIGGLDSASGSAVIETVGSCRFKFRPSIRTPSECASTRSGASASGSSVGKPRWR